jgi:hypothetical protein
MGICNSFSIHKILAVVLTVREGAPPDKDAALIEKSQQHEDNTGEEREQQDIQYEKSVEKRRRKRKMRIFG